MPTNTAAHAHRPWTAQDRDHAQEALAKTRGTLDEMSDMIARSRDCVLQSDDMLRHAAQSYREHHSTSSVPHQ